MKKYGTLLFRFYLLFGDKSVCFHVCFFVENTYNVLVLRTVFSSVIRRRPLVDTQGGPVLFVEAQM